MSADRTPAGRLRRLARAALAAIVLAFAAAGDAKAGEDVQAFLAELWPAARARGVHADTFRRAFANFALDAAVPGHTTRQPEFEKTVGEYIAERVSQTRIDNGRRKAAENAHLLAQIEARYGVDRHVLLAVWGMETAYGAAKGNRAVIRSLATLAMRDPRRAPFWRRELISALLIVQEQNGAPEELVGSWAGAMGHTQFIPSTYLRFAVDFDRNGQRDLTNSIADALASTANYLSKVGWVSGLPWGFEVRLPPGFDYAWSTPGRTRTLSEWLGAGIAPGPAAGALSLGTPLQLVLPAGAAGPAFLVTSNFRALLRYNQSVAYALSVGHLADRIAGAQAMLTAWPAERPLSRSEKEELQRLLAARGHKVGEPDGVIGESTRLAIRAIQRALHMPADGHPTPALLTRLRGNTHSAATDLEKRS